MAIRDSIVSLVLWGDCLLPLVVASAGCKRPTQEPAAVVPANLRPTILALDRRLTVFPTGNKGGYAVFADWEGREPLPEVTDADIELLYSHLACLPRIERMRLITAQISDRSLLLLSRLDNLYSLALGHGTISDDGISALARASHLESLLIRDSYTITGKGLRTFSDTSSLQELRLNGIPLTLEGAECISRITSLRHLEVSRVTVGDDAIRCFARLENLEVLHICGRVTDRGVEFLPHLPRLRELDVRYNPGVTDASVPVLCAMRTLKQLSVNPPWKDNGEMNMNRFSSAGIEQLKSCLGQEVVKVW
jgi:hypothetical protein